MKHSKITKVTLLHIYFKERNAKPNLWTGEQQFQASIWKNSTKPIWQACTAPELAPRSTWSAQTQPSNSNKIQKLRSSTLKDNISYTLAKNQCNTKLHLINVRPDLFKMKIKPSQLKLKTKKKQKISFSNLGTNKKPNNKPFDAAKKQPKKDNTPATTIFSNPVLSFSQTPRL